MIIPDAADHVEKLEAPKMFPAAASQSQVDLVARLHEQLGALRHVDLFRLGVLHDEAPAPMSVCGAMVIEFRSVALTPMNDRVPTRT